MKKRIVLITTSILVGMSLTACSTDSSTSSSKASESSSISESSVSVTSESTESSATTEKISIEDLSKSIQLSMDQMVKENQMFSDTYSSITVTSEGKDTLLYTYTYKDEIPEESKQVLIDSLEQQSEQLVAATKVDAEKFKLHIPGFKAKYIYKNNDGKILYEKFITEEDYNK